MSIQNPIDINIHGELYNLKFKAISIIDRIQIFFRYRFIRLTGGIAEKIATFFGYPENSGLPLKNPYEVYDEWNYKDYLPKLSLKVPPQKVPITYTSIMFGTAPFVYVQERVYFFRKTLGYYNYYIDHYKQFYFLPGQISKFLQLNLEFCLDIRLLEDIRAIIFAVLCVSMTMFSWKITLGWLVGFNPYNFPFNILIGFTDTVEDRIDGMLPSIFGVALALNVFITLLGMVADSLNYLIFTMPYLPSEGLKSFRLVERQPVQTIVFSDIPKLWIFHPIPNDVRKYWAYERPEILTFMELTYKDLNINFRPDESIIEESSIKQLLYKILINVLIFIKIILLDMFIPALKELVNNVFYFFTH